MVKRTSTSKQFDSAQISAIDLFCGAGGLTHGLENAGINVAAGVDLDPACSYPFEANNKARFIEKSVTELSCDDINPIFNKAQFSLLAGCAPCQPFSKYSQGISDESDDRWNLLAQFQRLVRN